MSYEVVQPTVVRVEDLDMDLQFFVSSDGRKIGMSQSALARLCGVGENAIRPLLEKLTGVRTWSCPKCLKPAQDNVFVPALTADLGNTKTNKIVSSEAAAIIIEYYAWESKVANDVAKKSFRAFARVGIETWIKTITGFTQEHNQQDVMQGIEDLKSSMAVMFGEIKEVKEELKDFKRVVTVYPKLDNWKQDMKLLSPFGEEFSVKQYLEAKNLPVDDTTYRKIRLQAAQAYKTLTGVDPKQSPVYKEKNGKKVRSSFEYVYRSEDLPMLEEVSKKVMFNS